MDERIAWWIFFATIPAAIAGALGESRSREARAAVADRDLPQRLRVLLYIADRSPQQRRIESLGFWPTFLIGTSQILALMPGVSRSGITITTGRFLRLDRDAAARFAFLLLIPIVFGAVVYKGLKNVVLNPLPPGSRAVVVGTLAAAAIGLIAIDLLLGYLRRHDYTIFVIYRLVLAAADRDRDHQRLARRALPVEASATTPCRNAHGRPSLGKDGGIGRAQPTEQVAYYYESTKPIGGKRDEPHTRTYRGSLGGQASGRRDPRLAPGRGRGQPGDQRQRIERECEREGLTLVAVHEEPNISGGADLDHRPGLRPAVEMVESGQVDAIVAAYFDRLFRSTAVQIEVLERIERAGGEVLTVDIGAIRSTTRPGR